MNMLTRFATLSLIPAVMVGLTLWVVFSLPADAYPFPWGFFYLAIGVSLVLGVMTAVADAVEQADERAYSRRIALRNAVDANVQQVFPHLTPTRTFTKEEIERWN
jgi:hypothetical protein